MMHELMAPVVSIVGVVALSVFAIDKLCLFHAAFWNFRAKLESEAWLLESCKDPVFFSNLGQHSKLCFAVESNHRIGAFMLALDQVAHSLRVEDAIARLLGGTQAIGWPLVAALALCVLAFPSLLSGAFHQRPRVKTLALDAPFTHYHEA
jgi:hypothetical protein